MNGAHLPHLALFAEVTPQRIGRRVGQHHLEQVVQIGQRAPLEIEIHIQAVQRGQVANAAFGLQAGATGTGFQLHWKRVGLGAAQLQHAAGAAFCHKGLFFPAAFGFETQRQSRCARLRRILVGPFARNAKLGLDVCPLRLRQIVEHTLVHQ